MAIFDMEIPTALVFPFPALLFLSTSFPSCCFLFFVLCSFCYCFLFPTFYFSVFFTFPLYLICFVPFSVLSFLFFLSLFFFFSPVRFSFSPFCSVFLVYRPSESSLLSFFFFMFSIFTVTASFFYLSTFPYFLLLLFYVSYSDCQCPSFFSPHFLFISSISLFLFLLLLSILHLCSLLLPSLFFFAFPILSISMFSSCVFIFTSSNLSIIASFAFLLFTFLSFSLFYSFRHYLIILLISTFFSTFSIFIIIISFSLLAGHLFSFYNLTVNECLCFRSVCSL